MEMAAYLCKSTCDEFTTKPLHIYNRDSAILNARALYEMLDGLHVLKTCDSDHKRVIKLMTLF